MTSTEDFRGSTLLLTGGGGFLGSAVTSDLLALYPGRIISVCRTAGHGPAGPAGPAGPKLPPPHVEHHCDLLDGAGWHDRLAEADYVLWMAALRDHSAAPGDAVEQNVAPLRSAVSALRRSGRLRRIVYVSSISAVDQPPYPQSPQAITDNSDAHPSTPYGLSKLMAEQVLRESGLPHTILRLPFLYGPGFRRGSFLDFYRTVATNPVLGMVRYTGKLSLLYTGDVARLALEVLAPANAAQADTSPYVVSDGRTYAVDDLISMVCRLHGRRRPAWRTPAWLGSAVAELALRSRALFRPGPVRRGRLGVLAAYWSHAAFSDCYFVVNPNRFMAAFPAVTFTPLDVALSRTFAGARVTA